MPDEPPLGAAIGPPEDANYDDARVGPYRLPDPLQYADGSAVTSAESWTERRRPELVRLFEEHVFGRSPPPLPAPKIADEADARAALGGVAMRRQLAVSIAPGAPGLHLLIYLPLNASAPVPVFLGPNFLGNHTVHADPAIKLSESVFVSGMDVALAEGHATDASRGRQSDRWPIERIIERGYGVATFFYGDLYPDRADGRALSIQPFLDAGGGRAPSWGAIATWSYAMSRALDALVSMPEIDGSRIALIGHSRHGKAALWAGALDQRFRLVIASNSGKGGASLMRRNFGETIRHLVTRYPHWFARRYAEYADREPKLPVDQHLLIALIAPRPVYIASAAQDLWADPKGEFLSAHAASPVYRLLGTDGLAADAWPPIETPVTSTIGYHIRRGAHGVTGYDWERFLDFAHRHMI